jgi:hypothetical protein
VTDPLRDAGPGSIIRKGDPASSPLRPYGGSVRRELPLLEIDAGTWHAKAKVTPITGLQGATAASRRFEISISWHGPPMPGSGLPALAPGQAVDATDAILVGELELAKAIAMRAIDSVRAHQVPDLRAIKRQLAPER